MKTVEERFWAKVDTITPFGPDGDCWEWLAGKGNKFGYGSFKYQGKAHGAHRFAYELLVGLIPLGFVLDHLCRITSCVNPGHLEVVTQRINILRGESIVAQCAEKTHCLNDHTFDEANTYWWHGERHCRKCRCQRERERRARRKEYATGG